MNIAVWSVSGLLAVVFLVASSTKLFLSKGKLAKAPGGGWVLDFSAGFVKFLGAAGLLGAVGLIVPALLGIAVVLTPLAGVGLAVIMAGAAVVEFRRHAINHGLGNLAYFALASFVVFGRFTS